MSFGPPRRRGRTAASQSLRFSSSQPPPLRPQQGGGTPARLIENPIRGVEAYILSLRSRQAPHTGTFISSTRTQELRLRARDNKQRRRVTVEVGRGHFGLDKGQIATGFSDVSAGYRASARHIRRCRSRSRSSWDWGTTEEEEEGEHERNAGDARKQVIHAHSPGANEMLRGDAEAYDPRRHASARYRRAEDSRNYSPPPSPSRPLVFSSSWSTPARTAAGMSSSTPPTQHNSLSPYTERHYGARRRSKYFSSTEEGREEEGVSRMLSHSPQCPFDAPHTTFPRRWSEPRAVEDVEEYSFPRAWQSPGAQSSGGAASLVSPASSLQKGLSEAPQDLEFAAKAKPGRAHGAGLIDSYLRQGHHAPLIQRKGTAAEEERELDRLRAYVLLWRDTRLALSEI